MNEKSSANRIRVSSNTIHQLKKRTQNTKRTEIELKQFDKPVIDFDVNRANRLKKKPKNEEDL